jgi:enoyl-[acyl-carrier-protein] reductase (NADH)
VILEGKRILIAGMSDRRSIGFAIAQEAQRQGAEIILTSFGRMMSITQMTAKKLNPVPEILEMDTIDFDNSTTAWPKYDWMGVSKAALESVTRYLARDLGRYKIRVNAVCAGPLATLAASGIPGFKDFEEVWEKRAPLGWNLQDRTPVGRSVCVLLSDYLDMTTGELLHVDGGYHAMGTELPPAD